MDFDGAKVECARHTTSRDFGGSSTMCVIGALLYPLRCLGGKFMCGDGLTHILHPGLDRRTQSSQRLFELLHGFLRMQSKFGKCMHGCHVEEQLLDLLFLTPLIIL